MKTRKDISTISYNTEDFLVSTLESLISEHIISYYMYIGHFPESDEKKSHYHVYVRPNGQLDTMDLQYRFREFDPSKPNKPLGCIDFRFSEVDDWILYNEHFEPYLASKGESRIYHYCKDNFIFSCEDTFDFLYNHAFSGSKWAKDNQILQHLINKDLSPSDLIDTGIVPINMSSQLIAYLKLKSAYGTNRNGRVNHENHNF